VPTDATTGPISVTAAGGTATSATAFTVAPRITTFSPTGGPTGSSVVITGANFTGATAVKFNGKAAVFTVNSAAQITATVPSSATPGLISVTMPAGTGTSATSFSVAPQIASFSAVAVGQVDPDGITGAFLRVSNDPSQFGLFDVRVGAEMGSPVEVADRHVGVVEFDLSSLAAGLTLQSAILTARVKSDGSIAASTLSPFLLDAVGDATTTGNDATGSASLSAQLVSPVTFSYTAGQPFQFNVRSALQAVLDASKKRVTFRFEIAGPAIANISFNADIPQRHARPDCGPVTICLAARPDRVPDRPGCLLR
jgi:hypothetical protein